MTHISGSIVPKARKCIVVPRIIFYICFLYDVVIGSPLVPMSDSSPSSKTRETANSLRQSHTLQQKQLYLPGGGIDSAVNELQDDGEKRPIRRRQQEANNFEAIHHRDLLSDANDDDNDDDNDNDNNNDDGIEKKKTQHSTKSSSGSNSNNNESKHSEDEEKENDELTSIDEKDIENTKDFEDVETEEKKEDIVESSATNQDSSSPTTDDAGTHGEVINGDNEGMNEKESVNDIETNAETDPAEEDESTTDHPTNKLVTGTPTQSPFDRPTDKPTEKSYVATDDDPIKTEDEIHAEEEEVQELEIELKQEEKVARQAGGLGIFFGIVAMIFTAHQMSENPDGIYASICRLAITISSVVVKIVCMPCRKLIGTNGNPHYNGHMPISTNDYSYRNDPYRSNANAGFELS